MISNHIFKNSGNKEDSEDILQETLVAFWQNARKPGFELTAKLSTYLFSIAKNLWLTQLKKGKSMKGEKFITGNEHADNPELHSKMDYSIVRNAMDKLGDKCRNILIMFYFDGFDMVTIAHANGLSGATVAKAKKYQCLKQLEEIIKEKYQASDFYFNE